MRPFVPGQTPIARKEGWLNDARHSAALVFAPTRPVILIILTYRDNLPLSRARSFAHKVVRAVGIGT